MDLYHDETLEEFEWLLEATTLEKHAESLRTVCQERDLPLPSIGYRVDRDASEFEWEAPGDPTLWCNEDLYYAAVFDGTHILTYWEDDNLDRLIDEALPFLINEHESPKDLL